MRLSLRACSINLRKASSFSGDCGRTYPRREGCCHLSLLTFISNGGRRAGSGVMVFEKRSAFFCRTVKRISLSAPTLWISHCVCALGSLAPWAASKYLVHGESGTSLSVSSSISPCRSSEVFTVLVSVCDRVGVAVAAALCWFASGLSRRGVGLAGGGAGCRWPA